MKIDITDDMTYMWITSPEYPMEISMMEESLTAELPDSYILKKTNVMKNTKRKFIDEYGRCPIGLWVHVLKAAKSKNINVQLSPALLQYISQFNLGYDLFRKYVDSTFKNAKTEEGHDFRPYEYQIEAAHKLIKYKKCTAEISTSAGKTLISFIIFKYMFDKCAVKKMLYIVPNVDLAKQSIEKYQEYEDCLDVHKNNWRAAVLMSGLRKKQREQIENANLIFGTYQSLCKKPYEWFTDFNAVIVDEAHHASNKSCKTILSRCSNLVYAFGVTGTFPKFPAKGYENLIIQSYIGPLVYEFSADRLINEEKRATPIHILFQFLDWASQEEKKKMWLLRKNKDQEDIQAGTKILKDEEMFINSNYTRLKYIGDLSIKIKTNLLVLFGDIKHGGGHRVYEYIKENSEKSVYYVDGNTKPENREWFKQQMEDDISQKTVIVASIGTFGEGIDIKNVGTIMIISSSKSERIVRQICGRGLRMSPYKDKTVIIDIVDDLRYTETGKQYNNYMYKHYLSRKKIYEEQKFPCYQQKVPFFKNALI